MTVARRSTQSKELVRLSPLQFSLSVSIVVILLGGAGLAGYFYGLKQAARTAQTSRDLSQEIQETAPSTADTRTPVTFYSTLTKPREDVPVPTPSNPARGKPDPVKVKPSPAPLSDRGSTGADSGSGSIMLQVASYKDISSAKKLLEELLAEGYSGNVVRADLGDRGIWYRVRVGPYADSVKADRVLETLRKTRSLKGYVVK